MAQPSGSEERPPGREIFEATITGAQPRPFIPRLRSDPPVYETYHPLPQSLAEFREREGRAERKKLLYQMWKELPHPEHYVPSAEKASLSGRAKLTPMKAEKLQLLYEEELLGSCGGHVEGNSASPVNWKEFKEYAEAKEAGGRIFSLLTFYGLTGFRTLGHISQRIGFGWERPPRCRRTRPRVE